MTAAFDGEEKLIQRALESEEGRRELFDHAHTIALAVAKEFATKQHSNEKLAKIAMIDFHKAFYAYIRRTLTEHGKEDQFGVYMKWWFQKSIEKHLNSRSSY